MTTYLMYGVIGAMLFFMAYRMFTPVQGLRNLGAEQFQAESKGQRIIDVREPHEFKSGHIAGAVNIPLSQLSGKLSDIPQDAPIYLYCQGGMRSKQAGKLLSRRGYRNMSHLVGGISAWRGPVGK